jgi:plastocyanin
MKRALVGLMLTCFLTLLMIACSGGDTHSTVSPSSSHKTLSPPASQANTIHMITRQFLRNTITLKKGAYLTLVDDVAVVHVIANGTWESNGNSKYAVEAGAPKIDVEFNGNDSHKVGPFNTVGTFHLYCTVHEDMKLTVIVQ